MWEHVDCIKVFARMSPQGKAEVIREMQKRKGDFVLMCGDGGNGVGALKQADVGLALLSGYGNANTTSNSKDVNATTAAEDHTAVTTAAEDHTAVTNGTTSRHPTEDSDAAEVALNQQSKDVAKRAQGSAKNSE
jgi:magnesium-transporting ATPase (P-type)